MWSLKELTTMLWMFLLCLWLPCSQATSTFNGVHMLKSNLRENLQYLHGDCYWLSPTLNPRTRKPSFLSFTGHCCKNHGFMGFRVYSMSVNNRLEVTFKWAKDTAYYLAASSKAFVLERVVGKPSNKHRFIVANATQTSPSWVTIQSVSTKRYLRAERNGTITMVTGQPSVLTPSYKFMLDNCMADFLVHCGKIRSLKRALCR